MPSSQDRTSLPIEGRRLRIVSVNDVYALDNLPRLRTLVEHHRAAAPRATLLCILAGDFLAPSLLSSIDAGRGMIECLNLVGVTHVVLGNHEDDLPLEELRHRLRELSAVCLGTNLRGPLEPGLELPRHAVIDVDGARVGLVGAVMADPSVYNVEPFGGIPLAPANEAVLAETAMLLASGCDAVIPITHQSIASDRALAVAQRSPPYAAIIGGHEHTPMLVEVEGTWIVKAGSEATLAAITEIVFPSAGAPPDVTTRLEAVSGHAADPDLSARVELHMSRVRELASATLVHLTAPLSSVGTRRQQTSFGELLCSKLRDALGAETCLFNGGGIRAARDYPERITYGDIETEVPFDNEVVVVRMKGGVVRDAVAFSRRRAPEEWGAFLQVDDRAAVDGVNVVAIDGAPLDPEREYAVALVRELLLGLDGVEPLVAWARDNPALVPPPGSGREPKMVLVQAFAVEIWRQLGGFDLLDADRDDRITAEEVAEAVRRAHPSQPPSAVLVDLVLRAIDVDADRIISRKDAEAHAARGKGTS